MVSRKPSMTLMRAIFALTLASCTAATNPNGSKNAGAHTGERRLILAHVNAWGSRVGFALEGDELIADYPGAKTTRVKLSSASLEALGGAFRVLGKVRDDSVCGSRGRDAGTWIFANGGGIRHVAVASHGDDRICRNVQDAAGAVVRLAGGVCNTVGCVPEDRPPS
jgi:hypothetical protein